MMKISYLFILLFLYSCISLNNTSEITVSGTFTVYKKEIVDVQIFDSIIYQDKCDTLSICYSLYYGVDIENKDTLEIFVSRDQNIKSTKIKIKNKEHNRNIYTPFPAIWDKKSRSFVLVKYAKNNYPKLFGEIIQTTDSTHNTSR